MNKTAGMVHFASADCLPQDIYKVLSGSILPRPIAFVSTVDAKGVRNLAPFSFFTAVGSNPPTVCFCPILREGNQAEKDTLRNIRETEEFVINIVSEDFVEKMNLSAAEVGPEVDEFELTGLTPLPSDHISAPRVKESRIQMECRLLQIVDTGDQSGSGVVVLGTILAFHIDESIFDNFKINAAELKAVGRMGGPTFVRTQDTFALERPK